MMTVAALFRNAPKNQNDPWFQFLRRIYLLFYAADEPGVLTQNDSLNPHLYQPNFLPYIISFCMMGVNIFLAPRHYIQRGIYI